MILIFFFGDFLGQTEGEKRGGQIGCVWGGESRCDCQGLVEDLTGNRAE